jgi:hypothetical protein
MKNRKNIYFLGARYNNSTNESYEMALKNVIDKRDTFLMENDDYIEVIDEKLHFQVIRTHESISQIFGIITISYFQK